MYQAANPFKKDSSHFPEGGHLEGFSCICYRCYTVAPIE